LCIKIFGIWGNSNLFKRLDFIKYGAEKNFCSPLCMGFTDVNSLILNLFNNDDSAAFLGHNGKNSHLL
jgi:hypothetical protein